MRKALLLGLLLAGPIWAEDDVADQPEMIEVIMPELEGMAVEGQVAYQRSCAECHGINAGGLEEHGPPLIMDLYGPSERSDMDIILAIQLGHEQENWSYGDMSPPENIGFAEQGMVVEFLRQVQFANGVE